MSVLWKIFVGLLGSDWLSRSEKGRSIVQAKSEMIDDAQ